MTQQLAFGSADGANREIGDPGIAGHCCTVRVSWTWRVGAVAQVEAAGQLAVPVKAIV